jgi:hypothetical protein
MFGAKIVVADLTMEYPRGGDRYIMQLLLEMGYPWEILQWLNCMRKFLQVLFLLVSLRL